MKAKYIGREFDHINKNYILTYEYRGIKYEVIDFGWKGGQPLSWQHKNEQSKIDDFFSKEKKNHEGDSCHEGDSWEKGFEMFFDFVNA